MPTPNDFHSAFAAWFLGDSAVTALFPGGLVNQLAARDQAYPYARVLQTAARPPSSPDDRNVDLTLGLYAAGQDPDDAAVVLGRSLLSRLKDVGSRAEIRYTDSDGSWVEAGFDAVGEETPIPLQPRAGGQQVARLDLSLRFAVVRS